MFGLGGFDQTSFCGAGKEPAADEEQRTECEETAVVEPCVVRAFADMVDREDLVIHDPFNDVEPQPTSSHPKKALPLIAHRQSVVRLQRTHTPMATAIQVAAWKRPSHSVFVSSPETVVLG
jgi:hypothetical protein